MKKELIFMIALLIAIPQLTLGQSRYEDTEEQQLLCEEGPQCL